MIKKIFSSVFCFLPVLAFASDLHLDDLAKKFKEESIGISVVDLGTGEGVDSFRGDIPLIPASVQKIVLSAAAMKALGPEYTFKTKFFGRVEKNGSVPLLAVQGGGDPGLTIENLWLITRELRQTGVRRVESLRLDGTRIPDPKQQTGERAYEGPSGALSANFNAVELQLCPGPNGRASVAQISPGEVDSRDFFPAPLSFPPGESKCSRAYRSIPDPLVYFERLFVAFMKQSGVPVSSVSHGRVREDMPLLYTHESKPLRNVLDDLNHFSTNFIAEQVLAALGEDADGLLMRERGLARMRQYALSLGTEEHSFQFVDGSGLSRDNRLSARLLVRVLQDVYNDTRISPEFLSSLSILGESGTLKDRNYGKLPISFRGKTGTIDGVTALAGILFSPGGRIFSLAVIQNQVDNKERAFELERGLFSALNAL